MKSELPCNIVQDLLPNYIEGLTSEETNQAVEEHLHTCVECKEIYEQMTADIEKVEKVPTIELKFLKKIKKTKLLAAALCMILTIVLSYMLYEREFHYSLDKADLSKAVTENIPAASDAYVLETKKVDGILFASFKDQLNENVIGVAGFKKGINQKYRYVQSAVDQSSNYSSIVHFFPIETKQNRYTAVSGHNLTGEIKYYGLDFSAFTSPGYLADHEVWEAIKFEVPNQQFLEFYETEDLERQVKEATDYQYYNYQLLATSVYDENGNDLSDEFIVDEEPLSVNLESGKIAEANSLYVFIALVLGFGIMMTRYFLTE